MNNRFLKTRWPISCLVFFIVYCNNPPAYKSFVLTPDEIAEQQDVAHRAFVQIARIKKEIQNGDLLTRTGNDFTSESLRSLNQRDKTYSHCGIASIENDSLFVYHALGGEFNPDQKILRETLEQFAEPYSNRGMGLFRLSISKESTAGLLDTVQIYYQKGITFDMDFDLATNDHMYCAEFVAKCFARSSVEKIAFTHSFINSFEFIGVDDIFLHPLSKKIAAVVYK